MPSAARKQGALAVVGRVGAGCSGGQPAPSFELVRHAPLSYGTLDRAEALETLRASSTPRPGHALCIEEVVRDDVGGRLVRTRETDTIDGGDIELRHLAFVTYADGLLARIEDWDADQLDAALVRYEQST